MVSRLSLQCHQIPLKTEEDMDKTTFTCHRGLFQWRRCSFSLVTAPSIFNYCLQNVLKDLSFCIVFMDDILIASKSWPGHLKNLASVFQKLCESGLKLKLSKCEFLKSQVPYLGHIISRDGVSVDPEKVSRIKIMSVPNCVRDLTNCRLLEEFYC